MKTNLLRFSLLLSLPLFLSCQDEKDNTNTLSLEAYTKLVNQVIVEDTSRTQGFTTARESILNQAEGYRKQYEQLKSISVPAAVASAHTNFVNALNAQYQSNLDAGQHTPEGLSASPENVNEFAHYRADVGYARDDESKAGCQLKSILSQSNLTLNVPGICEAANSPRVPDKAAGTTQQPVSEVYILHDVIRETDGSVHRPNVDGFAINSLVAKAQEPLTITFDNKNGAPFVFSFSIYKGADIRLKGADFVAGTVPYSGVKVHKLTVTLAPGTYTYVDNVHPIAMRGTLTVVP